MSQALVCVLLQMNHLACGTLVPQAGIQPAPFALEAQTQPLDHQEDPK